MRYNAMRRAPIFSSRSGDGGAVERSFVFDFDAAFQSILVQFAA